MSIEEMKDIDIRTVDPQELVDVTTIAVDESLPKEERMAEFIRQVKNPYCFRVGDMVVKNVYSNDGVSLKERFVQFARTLQRVIAKRTDSR
jgi:CxxC motif-containing protein